jgi:hypothetical protein
MLLSSEEYKIKIDDTNEGSELQSQLSQNQLFADGTLLSQALELKYFHLMAKWV